MKPSVRFSLVIGVVCLIALAVRGQVTAPRPSTKPAPSKSAPADNARLRALLTEKRDALRQIEESRRSDHQQGIDNQEHLIRASLAVIDADLDLAQTPNERVALCEKRVRLRRELESFVQAQRQAGVGTLVELQQAKVDRLDAEIALERERDAASRAH